MLKTVVIILLVLLGITAAQYLDEGTQKKNCLGHWGRRMRASIGRHRCRAFPLAKAAIAIAHIGLTPTRYNETPHCWGVLLSILCSLSLSL